jgi:hypothetical protein
MKDSIVEIAIAGVRCRFVQTCPPDALPYHSIERGLPRYVGDTTEGFRTRLIAAPEIWETGDTAIGIAAELNRAGFANVRIEGNDERPYAAPGHRPNGTQYAVGEEYWRFWVVIDDREQHLFGPPSRWGWASWATFNWGFSTVPPNWDAVSRIIKKHKPADSICAGIDIIISGPNWGEFTWGDGSQWGTIIHVGTGYR